MGAQGKVMNKIKLRFVMGLLEDLEVRTVEQDNILRDCQIALGLKGARPETVKEAKSRVSQFAKRSDLPECES